MPTILVLGAASDMAVAIAKKFASKGFAVQLAARNTGRLQPLQSDIEIRYQAGCTIHEFDALKFETHQSFYGLLPVKPDVTVCVFGYLGDQQLAQTNWDECKKIIDSNYTGAVSILNIIANDYAAKQTGC